MGPCVHPVESSMHYRVAFELSRDRLGCAPTRSVHAVSQCRNLRRCADRQWLMPQHRNPRTSEKGHAHRSGGSQMTQPLSTCAHTPTATLGDASSLLLNHDPAPMACDSRVPPCFLPPCPSQQHSAPGASPARARPPRSSASTPTSPSRRSPLRARSSSGCRPPRSTPSGTRS